MYLTRLEITHLRIIQALELEPRPGLNLFIGPNGSGKTSMLEAVHLLGTGRSFRSRSAQDLIQREQVELTVHALLGDESGGSTNVGVEKRFRGTRIRVAGEAVRSASTLAQRIPLVLVPPDSQRLLSDGSDLRRRFIDWGMFHVEPSYSRMHRDYRRALQQRNAQLQGGASTTALAPWNRELAETGEILHGIRARHLTEMLPRVATLVSELLSLEVSIHYYPGWSLEKSLEQSLGQGAARDLARGFTGSGPHRADLNFEVAGGAAQQVLSRGEAKLFCLSLWLAQAQDHLERAGRRPLILIDDLAAELDPGNRQRVFSALAQLGAQTFVTAVSEEVYRSCREAAAGFHVERGTVREMV